MKLGSFYTGLLLIILIPNIAAGQEEEKKEDSSPDSSKVYKGLKAFAEKRKFTYWIYRSVFKEAPKPLMLKRKGKGKTVPYKDNYAYYRGKIIRNIAIQTFDPFGVTVYDTIPNESKIERFGNALHVKSRRLTIRNQLLFKKGEAIDPLKITESERILRASAYVRDAKITIINPESDTVDVKVVVQDVWSITANAAVNTTNATGGVRDVNFLGLSHQFDTDVLYDYATKKIKVDGSYVVPYIKNTFITGRLYYNKFQGNTVYGVSLNRDFYSTLTKWAGGIAYDHNSHTSIYPFLSNAKTSHDYWLGRSFKFIPGTSDFSRNVRLVLTGRLHKIDYTLKPSYDDAGVHKNSLLLLSSFGISERKYYKDNFIFKYGIMEDVPEGKLFSIILGSENREGNLRYYLGAKSSFAKHFNNWGYLSTGWEYGTFSNKSMLEDGVVNAFFNFFTDLYTSRHWKFRQFLYNNLTHGIDKKPYQSISIEGNSLYGFNTGNLRGTDRLIVNAQTVCYLPYTFIGFNFAPLFFTGFGLLGDKERPLFNSKVYQVYGLGVLIKNENLIINTIQISFGFFPTTQSGKPEYKYNPASVYDLRFRDLFLSKPDLIGFY